jgi:hypothetical protein
LNPDFENFLNEEIMPKPGSRPTDFQAWYIKATASSIHKLLSSSVSMALAFDWK